MSKLVCPECKGSGKIENYSAHTGEGEQMICYNCGGSGRMPEGYFLEDSEDQPKTFNSDLILIGIGVLILGAFLYWLFKFIWV
jgi:hypothetical protein